MDGVINGLVTDAQIDSDLSNRAASGYQIKHLAANSSG